MALPRRRIRRPVLSRLVWAWLAFGAAAAGFSGLVFSLGDHWPERIALPVEGDVERLARPAGMARADDASGAVKITLAGGQGLRDAAAPSPASGADDEIVDVFATDEDEAYSASAAFEDLGEPLGGEVVITVDGKNIDAPVRRETPVQTPKAYRNAAPIPGPDPALLQKTQYGAIPRIGPGGGGAFKAYAHPFDIKDRRPKVAVIVGGLGLDAALTQRAIDNLPPEVTFAFAPYAKNVEVWADKARRAGHEIIIEIPMEGYGVNHAALGSAALLSSHTAEQNLQRLDWLLSRFGGYFAATNYQGGKFSADADAMTPVLSRLHDLGLAYFDDTGAVRRVAGESGGRWAIVNRVIAPVSDNEQRTMLREDLEALERIARRDGDALGKTYAYGANIEEIEQWASKIESRGLAIAPASAVLQARGAAR